MEEIESVLKNENYEMPIIKEQPIKVYVKLNENNDIIDVGSSIFLEDLTGWIEIDSGVGDKYAHAQSQYFDKPLLNENGTYNFNINNIK